MEPDKKAEDEHKEFMKDMGMGRKIRAWWSVRGPEVLFVGLVVGMQIAFGTWYEFFTLNSPLLLNMLK